MRAITVPAFGEVDVLAAADVPVPEPGPGRVAIDVAYASVTLADVLMRRGVFGGDLPLVPGLEVVGTIRSLGDGVSDADRLAVGDAVVTLSRPYAGGYAEVSVADAAATVRIGALDPVRALVSVPNTATALAVLTAVAHLVEGERVLVHGALGALGVVLGRVARSLGASQVDATVRREDQRDAAIRAGFDRALLADDVVADPAATTADATDGNGWDVVLDPVGGPIRGVGLELLAPLGRIVVVGDASGDDSDFAGDELWSHNATVSGFGAGPTWQVRPELAREVGRRAVGFVLDQPDEVPVDVLALEVAAEAHRRLEHGERRRLVLRI